MTKSQAEKAANEYAVNWTKPKLGEAEIHAIENAFLAGYALAEKRVMELEDALEFYGYSMDWDRVNNHACIQDRGKRARAALAKLEKGADE